MLALIDSNGDGTISADELAKATEVLKALDTDGDGAVSPIEVRAPRRQAPEAGRRPRRQAGEGPATRLNARRPDSQDQPAARGRARANRPALEERLEGRGDRRRRPGVVGGSPNDRAAQGPGQRAPQGGPGSPPIIGALPPFVLDQLDLNDEQLVKIRELDHQIRQRLNEILNNEQAKRLPKLMRQDPGPGGPGRPGGRGDEGPTVRPRRPMESEPNRINMDVIQNPPGRPTSMRMALPPESDR